jgi:predicted alpha/beta hydrolase family esterase
MALLLLGCASPAERLDREAAGFGFHRSIVTGNPFRHVVYVNSAFYTNGPRSAVVHVYLEGDGSPWLDSRTVSPDPTPRRPLMLRLMAQDPAPAVYLGRPCYLGLVADAECSPLVWTSGRYSDRVVASMAQALRKVLASRPADTLVFLGHSGGGTLAMLLAERFPRTRAVLTIAGNLDVHAWAKLHEYSPLRGSLDPSHRPPLPRWIFQLHGVGAKDRNIPLSILKAAVARQPGARLVVFGQFGHVCCWESVWRVLLGWLPASGEVPRISRRRGTYCTPAVGPLPSARSTLRGADARGRTMDCGAADLEGDREVPRDVHGPAALRCRAAAE